MENKSLNLFLKILYGVFTLTILVFSNIYAYKLPSNLELTILGSVLGIIFYVFSSYLYFDMKTQIKLASKLITIDEKEVFIPNKKFILKQEAGLMFVMFVAALLVLLFI